LPTTHSHRSTADALLRQIPAPPEEWRWALIVYGAYRVLLSAIALVITLIYPLRHGGWQPPQSDSLSAWAEWLFLQPFDRYDVGWYTMIAADGYDVMLGARAFHPLFPALMGLVGRLLGVNMLLGGMLVAQVSCVLMLVLLYKLVRLDYSDAVARRATLFLAASPLGLSFFIPYTEPLLMVGVLGAFYAARKERWILAGLAGAGAILTKQPGAAVVLPLLWELWRQRGDAIQARQIRPLLAPLVCFALMGLSVVTFLVIRSEGNDLALDLARPGTIVAGLLVSPDYATVWDEHFAWPWESVVLAVERLLTQPASYIAINFFGMVVMLGLALHSMRTQRPSYTIFTVTLVLLSLSIYYPSSPYMGILRRFTIIFPIFIHLALLFPSRRATAWVTLVSTLGLVYVTIAYVRNAFLP
jgi:hypothetical protein